MKEKLIEYFNSHPSIEELFIIPSNEIFEKYSEAYYKCVENNLDKEEIDIVFREELT